MRYGARASRPRRKAVVNEEHDYANHWSGAAKRGGAADDWAGTGG